MAPGWSGWAANGLLYLGSMREFNDDKPVSNTRQPALGSRRERRIWA